MAKQKYWNGTSWEVVGTDASKVDIVDSGNIITATDVEGALQEIKTELAVHQAEDETQAHLPLNVGLGNVLNVEQIPVSEKGAVNGVATLGADGKLTPEEGATWVKIAEQTLASAVAQVDFASIPSGYKNFRLMIDGRGTDTNPLKAQLKFNNDATSGNYIKKAISAGLSSITTSGATLTETGILINDVFNALIDAFSYSLIEISNFNPLQTKRVQATVFSTDDGSSGGVGCNFTFGAWKNTTTEINKISISVPSASIAIGSRLVLWGCK